MSRLHLCVDAIFYMFTGSPEPEHTTNIIIIEREKVIVNLLRKLAPLTIIAKCLHACMLWIPQLISTACAIPDIIIHYDPCNYDIYISITDNISDPRVSRRNVPLYNITIIMLILTCVLHGYP